MRRRLVTVGLCCAALAATAPVPAAVAQDASSSTAAGSTAAPASTSLPAGLTPAAGGASTGAPASTAAQASTAAPASSSAPAGVSSKTSGSSSDDHKTEILVLGLLGALLLLAALAWGVARWWAWEPPWWIRWRHATAEAGWRTSAAWAEFRDWMRLGR